MFPTKDNPIIYEISGSADIQKVLERIDPIKLIQKISNFRKLNIRDMNDQQISEAIFDVLCWDGYFACYTNMKTYPAGTSFFRVKKLVGSNLPNERFGVKQDYWETPSKYLNTYGRLNKPGESLLYVSPDMSCAIKEMKLKYDEYFAVIKYTAADQIKVNMIGGDFDYDQIGEISEKAKLVHEIYRNFLCDEFSRDVGKGTEYLYRISEKIAKDHFDLPPRVVQDAWAYTSVQDKTKYNVCFRPEIAHDLLELNGAMICKKGEDTALKVYCVAVDSDENNNIMFYPVGSDVQKRAFPRIVAEERHFTND